MFGIKKPTKNQIEKLKTIALTIFVTGVVAFVLGMKFESRMNKQIEQARSEASAQVVKVEEVKQ